MQIELNHIYAFKNEFCKILKIPQTQIERKLDVLLDWMLNFFDYEFYRGCPNRIVIKEIYGEYKPLPRKAPKQEELTRLKKEKYDEYTRNQFSRGDYEPNSVMRVARNAKDEFGAEEFGHTNVEAIARRYVRESFHKYGEDNNHFVWVDFVNYRPLSNELLAAWAEVRKQEKIGEEEAAKAFYAQENGEDISEQKNAYKEALKKFKAQYGIIPVYVKEWRLKEQSWGNNR